MNHSENVIVRETKVDGISPWTWIAKDTGAWGGPKIDWESNHKATYMKYVKIFDTVVCAGGCQGMYPRLFSNIFKTVYTFEPDPLSFYCLVNNCQSDNVIKIQAALGYANKMIGVNRVSKENVGMNKIEEIGNIPMLMLDNFSFKNLNLLQLDVEGFEIHIIEGGLKTIEAHLPVISCENGNDNILNLIKQFGYSKVAQSAGDSIYTVG